MLSSPGNSPRHILVSEKRDTDEDDRKYEERNQAIENAPTPIKMLMGPPPPKKKRKPAILDEDTYVNAIEKIIERDYFPDIPKLQNRLEWLEAIRSRDPAVIRETQLRIIKRKAELVRNGATPSVNGTPRTSLLTPNSFLGGAFSPAFSLRTQDIATDDGRDGLDSSGNSLPDTNMSLDEFLCKYTSEDNASFSEIKEKDDNLRRRKAALRLSADQISDALGITASSAEDEKGREKTDGFGSTGQPLSTLKLWNYKAKNELMYDSSTREDAALSKQELDERVKGPPKEVVRSNTRFLGKVFDRNQGAGDETVAILYNPLQGNTPGSYMNREEYHGRQNYDLEAMKTEGENQQKGYDFVRTPSPAPGVDASPFMTWGEIEGTPVRLESEETPLEIGGSGDGPRFKLPEMSKRDETAHAMSKVATKNIRERQRLQGRFSSPSPLRTMSNPRLTGGSPLLVRLSQPAQKLVDRAMKRKNTGVDSNLRASYGALSPGMSPLSAGKYREGSLPLRSPSASPAVRKSQLSK